MHIKIQKINNLYSAQVTPSNENIAEWATDTPLSCEILIEKLKKLGCHQTDIGDAFYEADPNWLSN